MSEQAIHIPAKPPRARRRDAGRDKYRGPNAWMVKNFGNRSNGNGGHMPKKARNRKGRR